MGNGVSGPPSPKNTAPHPYNSSSESIDEGRPKPSSHNHTDTPEEHQMNHPTPSQHKNIPKSILDKLSELEVEFAELVTDVEMIESQLKSQDILVLYNLKNSTAQMIGSIDKFQFEKVDGIITEDLTSDRDQARARRKRLNADLIDLRDRCQKIHQHICRDVDILSGEQSPSQTSIQTSTAPEGSNPFQRANRPTGHSLSKRKDGPAKIPNGKDKKVKRDVNRKFGATT